MSTAFVLQENQQKARFAERFVSAWSRTDQLFNIVDERSLLARPIVWRHPLIFYVGHLPAFSWNQICASILGWKSFNPYFDDLFCRGIDPDVDTGACHWHPDVPDQWPSLDAITRYRDKVRQAILESFDAVPRARCNDVMARDGRVFEMVLEHEYMHQETLLYMMQELGVEYKTRPSQASRYTFDAAAPSEPIAIPPGAARLGARFAELNFGWDNEFSEVELDVPAFGIDSMPVTNGAFFEFVQCGAYDDPGFWRPQDWKWKSLAGRHHPNVWMKQGDSWCYRTMFDVLPLEKVAGWPVYVSVAEARAYASWRGKRLPSEAEFHRAAFGAPDQRESSYPWGDQRPDGRRGAFGFASWSPTPVGSHPAGNSRWGVGELVGNGWEWTDTPFAPFPGFVAYISGYPEYSQDFFDGKHYVLKGASWATTAELIRPSFRNWYQAHYPYVFAKFRCVSD